MRCIKACMETLYACMSKSQMNNYSRLSSLVKMMTMI